MSCRRGGGLGAGSRGPEFSVVGSAVIASGTMARRPPLTFMAGKGAPAHYFVNTGSVSQPRTVEVGESRALSRSTLPFREPGQDLFEGDAPLHAGERGPHAQVDAVAEGEMPAVLAVDVEGVAVGKAAIVAVGRAQQEEHHAAGGDVGAVDHQVLTRHASSDVGCRAIRSAGSPQWHSGISEGSATSSCSLVRVVGQDLGRPADQPGRGLVPCAGQHLQVGEQLVARQLADRAGLVDELDVQAARS